MSQVPEGLGTTCERLAAQNILDEQHFQKPTTEITAVSVEEAKVLLDAMARVYAPTPEMLAVAKRLIDFAIPRIPGVQRMALLELMRGRKPIRCCPECGQPMDPIEHGGYKCRTPGHGEWWPDDPKPKSECPLLGLAQAYWEDIHRGEPGGGNRSGRKNKRNQHKKGRNRNVRYPLLTI